MRYFNKAMLVASAALCLNLSVFSQNITLKTGSVTVKEAMEQLKKSSGYSFVFSSEDLDTRKHVSISVQNGKIEDAVKQILVGQNGITSNRFLLQRMPPLFLRRDSPCEVLHSLSGA